jgi:hypothetical protein
MDAMLERFDQWWEAAVQWMAIDDRVRALAAATRAVEEHSEGIPFLVQVPSLRPLHGEPGFQRLIRQTGLGVTTPASVLPFVRR